jgi:hypothetical protein
VQTDAALAPDRQGHGVQELLQQDERGEIPDRATGLVPLADQPVHPCLNAARGVGQARHFQQDAVRSGVQQVDLLL